MKDGILSFLQRVGIGEFEEEAAEAGPVPSVQPARPVAPAAQAVMPGPKPAAVIDPSIVEAVDRMAVEKLSAAMDKGSQLVEDLGDTLSTLEGAIADENLRYTTALSLMKKKGVDTVALLGDLDACIGALEKENRDFSSQLQDQFDRRVGSKVKAVEATDGEIASKLSQIEALQREIEALRSRRLAEHSGIAEEEAKLAMTKSRFESHYRRLRSAVESQKSKVTQYGGMA